MKKRLMAGLLVGILTASTVFAHLPTIVKAEEIVEETPEVEEETPEVEETPEAEEEAMEVEEETSEAEEGATETAPQEATETVPNETSEAATEAEKEAAEADEADETIPNPYYEFTFDNEGDGTGEEKIATNSGSKTDAQATIGGNGDGLGVQKDDDRNSNVLNLPGGGLNQGFLTLPENMYDDVTEEGFALSFWIKMDESANSYSRIFSSTLSEPNTKGWPYEEAEFAFVVGAGSGADYDTTITLSDASNRLRFKWNPSLTKAEWKYVTVSVTPDSYDIYLNGTLIGKQDESGSLANVLGKLFENNGEQLQTYVYNTVGRSVYTDNDLKAKLDEFRFYNTGLNETQAQAIYESYQVTVPTPVYEFSFEENTVDNTKVSNSEKATGEKTATLGGENPSVKYDSDLDSNVLNLPGGGTATTGYLSLPDDLFENVTGDNGFTISFWLKSSSDQQHYTRIFQSSSIPLGASHSGSNNWNEPEFVLVVGGIDESDSRYNSAIKATASSSKLRYEWDTTIGGNGKWGYVTVSVSKDQYTVYKNGEQVNIKDLTNNESTVLTNFFSNIGDFTNNALGQSLYTSDPNAKAMYDDFRFYDAALTKEQAITIYKEYGYEPEKGEYDDDSTLNFDITNSLGDMTHRSTGFLYGVSENNVPSTDLLSAIQPKILVQKAADGQQHPSGDAYRLTSYLKENGVENLQVYLQDYYLEWPYEYNGIDDYNEKVREIVTKMTAGKSEEERSFYSYVLFNEPDGIWYSNSGAKLTEFCNDWKTIYTTVKSIDENAKVAGPNFTGYHHNAYKTFLEFCKANDCLPEMITWHDLQKDKLTAFESEYTQIKGLIDIYYAESEIDPILFVNEIANFEDVGAPGPLVNWISIYEEKNVYAALPYWGLANSLNELAADANKPNSAWWVFKWYADMQGYKVGMTRENVSAASSSNKGDSLYGLTSVDVSNNTVSTLFGGHDGVSVVNLNSLTTLDSFKNATNAHVKIYRTRYSGHQGFADETPVIYEGNLPIHDGTLQIAIEDGDLLDAYYAVVTPAADESTLTINDYNSNWTATYEAEEAELLGAATVVQRKGGSDLARSNRADVGTTKKEADGVKYTVSVPADGKYKLQVYYSVPAPNVNALTLEEDAGGQNRAIGRVIKNKLVVDGNGDTAQVLNYKSTVKTGYYNYETVYLDLTAGEHTIAVTHYSTSVKVYAHLDKIDLTYETGINEEVNAPQQNIQLEEVLTSDYTMDQTVAGYTGGGYATGNGDITFNVVVAEDGLYDTTIRYQAEAAGTLSILKKAVDYAKDAKATTPISFYQLSLGEASVSAGEQWEDTVGNKIFLTAGANTITICANDTINLDQITFVKDSTVTAGKTLTIPAESAKLSGDAVPELNTYAYGNRVVTGIGGGSTDNKMQITFDVPEAGNYKLSMYYTNNEPAPVMKKQDGTNYVHPYNTDLVERYAQIVINGNEPETVYFRNTLSWDVFNNVVIDVELKQGTNTITFYNDNSYKFSELVDDYAPKFSKFEIIPATTAAGATVSMDKNYLYRAIMERKANQKGYTAGSYAIYAQAIEAAEQLYQSDGDITEAEILAAIAAIDAARGDFVSTEELELQIAEAKKYYAKEADYTTSSFAGLLEAIEQAENTLQRSDVTGADIEAEIEALDTAIKGLLSIYRRIDNSQGTITSSSSNPNTHPEYAWDGDTTTHPDLVNASGGWDSSAAWTQIEFAESSRIIRLMYAPRSGYTNRLKDGYFEISMDGDNWETIHTIDVAKDGYTTVEFEDGYECRFVRYHSPAGAYLNITAIDLYTSILDDAEYNNMNADRKQLVEASKAWDDSTVTENFQVPVALTNGSTITWRSDKEALTIDESGNVSVSRQEDNVTVTLTAVVTSGEVKNIYTYTVTVKGTKLTLVEISLKKLPSKTVYAIGEALNTSGMVVEAVYDDGSTTQIPAKDYTVTGYSATTAGKKTVTVEYQGKKVSFEVEVKAAQKVAQTITTSQSTYTKTFGDKAFSLGARTSGDGKISYSSSDSKIGTVDNSGTVTIKGVGKATITITAAETNAYQKAVKTVTLNVNPKNTTVSISKTSHTKVFGAKAFSLGAKTNGDGKLTYSSSNSKICTVNGKGKVTIKGTGKVTITIKAAKTNNYKKATKKVTITVKPKKVAIGKATSPKSGNLKVTWKKDSKASGYQVAIATNKKFTKNKETANISKNSTVTRSFSKLKKGSTYYARVRAYKKSGTSKIYGAYSNIRTIKVK